MDAVPAVFRTGLLAQHPICRQLFSTGRGVQGSSNGRNGPIAVATAARSAQAVEKVIERFETACDDLDSGLFDFELDQHCYCCMQFFGGAGVQLPGAWFGRARWPAPRVRDHQAPQRPLQWLLWLHSVR
jgi:hypothetical protein